MIIVTSPDKPFELTPKGTVRRKVTLAQYEQEVDDLYRRVEESSQSGATVPTEWTPESTLDFVHSVVQRVLQYPALTETDDLFKLGCDRWEYSAQGILITYSAPACKPLGSAITFYMLSGRRRQVPGA